MLYLEIPGNRDMNLEFWVTVALCLHAIIEGSISAEFEVTVPNTTQVARYGQSMVLSCHFVASQLASSVVTWQRGLEVVHSFYQGQDQLDQQSPHFANRTSLDYAEIRKGNASLKLDHITPDDAGQYTCSVSTPRGSQRKRFLLRIAAVYQDPRLSLLMTDRGFVVTMISEGGYPAPTLQWLGAHAEDISNHTNTLFVQDAHTQLYNVSSSLTLTGVTNISLTFILRNGDLSQELRREMDIHLPSGHGHEGTEPYHTARHWELLLLPAVLMGTICLIVLGFYCKNRRGQAQDLRKQTFHALNKPRPSSYLEPMSNSDLLITCDSTSVKP